MKKNIFASLAVLFTALGLTSIVLSAEPNLKYPIQPVKIVVPYTPGGISDLMGRSLASYLEKMGATGHRREQTWRLRGGRSHLCRKEQTRWLHYFIGE